MSVGSDLEELIMKAKGILREKRRMTFSELARLMGVTPATADRVLRIMRLFGEDVHYDGIMAVWTDRDEGR